MAVRFRGVDHIGTSPCRLLLCLEPLPADMRSRDEGDGLRGPLVMRCHGIAAHVARVHFPRNEVAHFAADLRAFASTHEGEAAMGGWLMGGEAGTVWMRVWAPDLARHAALELTLVRDVSVGNAAFYDRVQVTFLLDPSRWEEPLAALEAVLALH